MSKKNKLLTARSLKYQVFRLCLLNSRIAQFFNFYPFSVPFENLVDSEFVFSAAIYPTKDYGLTYLKGEIDDIFRCSREELLEEKLSFNYVLLSDVTVLGHTGLTVSEKHNVAINVTGTESCKTPRNWVKAKHLRAIGSEKEKIYVNLMGPHKGHKHFFHFFTDLLVPLFWFLRNYANNDSNLVVLVRDDLNDIQIDAFKFIETEFNGVKLKPLKPSEKIYCKNLFHITYQNRHSGRSNILARDYINDIVKIFIDGYGLSTCAFSNYGKQIYIERGDAKLRRIQNEEEIKNLLQVCGFEFYNPGSMPFKEQIKLFSSAKVIVSIHGAALTNLMFSEENTKVLEIFPSDYIDESYLRLSKIKKIDYNYLIGSESDKNQNFNLDLSSFEEKLREMEIIE